MEAMLSSMTAKERAKPEIINAKRKIRVAKGSGTTVRALQRLFQEYVGVSPKWVLRRFRIHEAAERLAAGARIDAAAFASECGYFDQAHFIRDFKAQVGRTPGEYAEICASAPARWGARRRGGTRAAGRSEARAGCRSS